MSLKERQLVNVLKKRTLLTESQIQDALEEKELTGDPLEETLINLGYISEEGIMSALAAQLGISYISIAQYIVDPEAVRSIPADIAYKYQVFPLRKDGLRLIVAMVDPLNSLAIQDMKLLTGLEIEPVICSKREIEDAQGRYYLSPKMEEDSTITKARDIWKKLNLSGRKVDLPSPPRKKSLEDLFLERGLLTPPQMNIVKREAEKTGDTIDKVIIRMRLAEEEEVAEVLSRYMGLPLAHLSKDDVDPQLVNLVPCDFIISNLAVPMTKHNGELTVAMVDPRNEFALREIEKTSGYRVKPVLCLETELMDVCQKLFGNGESEEEQDKAVEVKEENTLEENEILILSEDKALEELAPTLGKEEIAPEKEEPRVEERETIPEQPSETQLSGFLTGDDIDIEIDNVFGEWMDEDSEISKGTAKTELEEDGLMPRESSKEEGLRIFDEAKGDTGLKKPGDTSLTQRNSALKERNPDKASQEEALIPVGATEGDLAQGLAKRLNLPYVDITDDIIFDPFVLELVPEAMARRHTLIPLKRDGNTLHVAMADPRNVFAIDDLKLMTGLQVKPVVSTREQILRAIDIAYETPDSVNEMVEGIVSTQEVEEEEEIFDDEDADSAPVIKFVDMIIRQAYQMGASDIHIEPAEKKLSVRYRIDGILQEAIEPSQQHKLKKAQNAIISRLKILSDLDIAERRIPQDGRITFKREREGINIDLRVSTLPAVYGEKVVMRILEGNPKTLDITKLGFSMKNLETFREAIRKPYGMILLSGPTGSGKTTTLYSALSEINTLEKNIITLEDPVEYKLAGINQVQVNPKIGFTFAKGLRAFLRQDPDIMMVGEIRDFETAESAIEAALTGHLVFSTIHTNDAAGVLTRLTDMKVEPFLIASAVLLAVAQRLVRRLCEQCKELYTPTLEELKRIIPNFEGEPPAIYRAVGCSACNNFGYKGRMAINEVLKITDPIRQLVIDKKSAGDIGEIAKKEGMKRLIEDGMEKVFAGLTSIEEVLRVSRVD